MDYLQDWELELLMDNFIYHHKQENENNRLLAYNIIAPNLTNRYKNKTMEELFPLMSDDIDINKIEAEHNHEISDDEIKLINKMSEFAKDLDFTETTYE